MTLSQLALEDVEALCSETSFLTADPAGSLLDRDDEDAALFSLEEEGPPSPPLLSACSSPSPHEFLFCAPPASASPPASPLGPSVTPADKAGAELLFMPWLSAGSLLDAEDGADDCKDDAFVGMDWMAEKIDLSELDLDSLMGSCSSDISPSSPEVLLSSLDPPMDLDLDPLPPAAPCQSPSVELSPPLLNPLPPEPPVLAAKDGEMVDAAPEPLHPAAGPPSPAPAEPPELRSDGDVQGEEQTAASRPGSAEGAAPIVLSLPPAGSIVVLLADQSQALGVSLLDHSDPVSSVVSEWDSDSGIESLGSSPTRILSAGGSSRTKPYAKPSSPTAASKFKQAPVGAPKLVEKKLKKMEQNKTAATRYRHKKRIEQELLNTELEELEKRNGELTEKADSISREIKYLKDLMEEVRKHHRGKTSSAGKDAFKECTV